MEKCNGQKRYEDLVRIFPDIIWEVDEKGRIIYCNAGINFDLSSEDFSGFSLSDIMPEEEKVRIMEIFSQSISDPQPFYFFQSEYIDKNGNKLFLESNGVPVFGENNRFSGYRGITRDITSRKITENKLVESTNLNSYSLSEIENLYNSLPVGLCVLDTDLRFVRINSVLAEINGFPVSYHIGRTVREVIPDLADFSESLAEGIIETGEPMMNIEISGSTKARPDDVRSWIENWIPIKDSSGKVIAISVGAIEITEQIQIRENLSIKQQQLERAMRDLENSQKKLNITLENGNIGLWELDIKTKLFSWDERAAAMFNLSSNFNGTIDEVTEYIHEEDLEYVRRTISEAIVNSQSFKVIFRTRSHKGYPTYISASALVQQDENGEPINISGVCLDVTDMRKGAEATLMKLNEDLLRSNNDLMQFAYVASHDLQEPLRMIASFTQMLQHRYHDKLDAEANEYINFAVDGAKRMYGLINGLLDFSRVQTMGREFRDVDMNIIVERAKSNLQLVIKERNAVLKADNLPVIQADENQMLQLVQNLIGNAIKFSRDSPQVTITYELTGAYHEFAVSDKGIGIDPLYSDKIFRIFQKLNSPDKYEGTGIGLAVCKRIVNRHGGKIWVISGIGQGAIFYFTIPKQKRQPFLGDR